MNYDITNWNYLIDYLNSENYDQIDKINRAQLIDDAFNLARSGRLNYSIPLSLATYLKKETHFLPLYSFSKAIAFLDMELSQSEKYDSFKVPTTSELLYSHNMYIFDASKEDIILLLRSDKNK